MGGAVVAGIVLVVSASVAGVADVDEASPMSLAGWLGVSEHPLRPPMGLTARRPAVIGPAIRAHLGLDLPARVAVSCRPGESIAALLLVALEGGEGSGQLEATVPGCFFRLFPCTAGAEAKKSRPRATDSGETGRRKQ